MDLDRLEKLCKDATNDEDFFDYFPTDVDHDFHHEARTAIPLLIKRVREAEKTLTMIRDLGDCGGSLFFAREMASKTLEEWEGSK